MEVRSEHWPPGLYLLPSPLGNLDDLTFRVVKTLEIADLVAAEDTRRTRMLLSHLGLRKKLISYREQNHERSWPEIEKVLSSKGIVAQISDAGAPVVSDPGALLVAKARQAGFAIVPLPGPSAVITALMASGFSGNRFLFGGFLPSSAKERQSLLNELKNNPTTIIFFETPHRLKSSLKDLLAILGNRNALLAREMTKLHEEYLFDSLENLYLELSNNPRRGELTIVIEACEPSAAIDENDLEQLVLKTLNDGRSSSEIAKELSKKTGRNRKEIYNLLIKQKKLL